ncbi:60S acidic ribosomal protein P1 [Porphyridium purpureum]|uniref:60S acidic ribosomal protein P1 n=1 Tax=Porphyridium purpureum TaxID=35688 RepID=A0A5J4YQQ1_PORPP|nr:60S acidic ribosomal protein P1 [Porphyridium purpureum]|eukprot:POR7805..scf296_7
MVASTSELACVYAALIVADDGGAVSADAMSAVLSAAGVTVESYYPAMFAKALSNVDIEDIVSKISSATPSAGSAPPAPRRPRARPRGGRRRGAGARAGRGGGGGRL